MSIVKTDVSQKMIPLSTNRKNLFPLSAKKSLAEQGYQNDSLMSS